MAKKAIGKSGNKTSARARKAIGTSGKKGSASARAHFLNGLRERGEVVDETSPPAADQGGRASAPRPTHQIVRDEQGRRVLRRQRISMV